jgi:tRNA (adenine57-N1/adenine58-N1)-methyltransferase catalytic subunit
MKVLVKGKKRFYCDSDKCHTNFGVIEVEGREAVSNKGVKFKIFNAGFSDKLVKVKRGPALVNAKEAGMIIATTGVGKDSVVLDAGAGTGVLTSYLARVCKKVYSYEVREDFFKIVEKNLAMLGLDNVKLVNKSVEEMSEKNLDLVTLDLLDAWKYFGKVHVALKSGGWLVCYVPNINQVQECVKLAEGFVLEKVSEVLEREWIVESKRLRPENQMLGHTAFLVFFRKF